MQNISGTHPNVSNHIVGMLSPAARPVLCEEFDQVKKIYGNIPEKNIDDGEDVLVSQEGLALRSTGDELRLDGSQSSPACFRDVSQDPRSEGDEDESTL